MRHCQAVVQAEARNFIYGLKLTPEPKRSALYVVYAYMRASVDVVGGDLDCSDAAEMREALTRLAEFRQQTDEALDAEAALPPGPIWPAVRHVSQTFGLDRRLLHDMIDAQQMNVSSRRYATFEELYGYCYRVASAVGLVCLEIWGHDGDPGVFQLAEYRGVAFQLTNIVRDVAKDVRCDRVYLPQEELARFRVTEEQLRVAEPSHGLDRLLQFQIERARSYYEMSQTLERHLAPDGRAASWTMMQIYRRLLERIARNPHAVLRGRVSVPAFQKIAIAVRGKLRHRGAGDAGGL